MIDGIWRPEFHDGRGNFARGWFARRTIRAGAAIIGEVTGGLLGLYPFADQSECQAWCDARNGAQADDPLIVDGGKDADSYKLNPGGHRA